MGIVICLERGGLRKDPLSNCGKRSIAIVKIPGTSNEFLSSASPEERLFSNLPSVQRILLRYAENR